MFQFFFHRYYFIFFSSHELILFLVYCDEFFKTQIRLGLPRRESIVKNPLLTMALTCILTKHDSRRYSYINHIFSFSENEKVKDKGF